ncbi:MAG TPA: hypothetical protein PKC58_17585 [Ignavibacteria bacterium]|nr:hypothetical protein [Ignavibacteria bacterium]
MDKIIRKFIFLILIILLFVELGCLKNKEPEVIEKRFGELENILKNKKNLLENFCNQFINQKDFRKVSLTIFEEEPWYVKAFNKYELIFDYDFVPTKAYKNSYVRINFTKLLRKLSELKNYDQKEMEIILDKNKVDLNHLLENIKVKDDSYVYWGNLLLENNFSSISYSRDFPGTISLGYFHNFSLIYALNPNDDFTFDDRNSKLKKIDTQWYLFFSK